MNKKHGRLEIKEIYLKKEKRQNRSFCWCLCDCGNYKEVRLACLKNGDTKSCGCLHKESVCKHGKSKNNRLYRIWINMKARCLNQKDKHYKDYGGRGIKICKAWQKNYIKFEEWALSNGYSDDLTIDRIDNNGNYEPKNCKFSTVKEQNNNQRARKGLIYLIAFGEIKTIRDWLKDSRCNVKNRDIINKRIKLGWSHEDIIKTRVN